MRNLLKPLAIATTAMLAPVSSPAQTLPPGPPIKIQAVTQPGPTYLQYTRVDIPLLRDGLAKASGGRIEVTLASWPERNLNGPEIIRLVRSGQVDIGAVPLGTAAGDVPLLDVVDLAGLNPSLEQARKVATAILPEVNKALEKTGTMVVATYPFPAQVFFCRDATDGIAALKGKKVRTYSASLGDLVTAFGGQPVTIGFPEVYAALERGVADCGITGTASGNSARWYEVTKGLYALPVGYGVAMYIVNTKWWNALDPAVRSLLARTMKDVEDAQWKLGEEASEDGISCNAGERDKCKLGKLADGNPMKVTRASEADLKLLRLALESAVLPGWVKRCGPTCGEFYNTVVAPITGVRFQTN
jgi:TRAP-type C4-dicarboxylate transport system substrate-binding protein